MNKKTHGEPWTLVGKAINILLTWEKIRMVFGKYEIRNYKQYISYCIITDI
jgi:hypothetical protein